MFLGFVHVPKTGGSTIVSEGKLKFNGTLCNNNDHAQVSELMKHNHNHYFISLVRDPYQQSISKYYNMKRNNIGGINFSLEDFLSDSDHRDWSKISYSFFYDRLTPKDFSFVGVTNHMEKNRIILKKIFQVEFSKKPINVNDIKKYGTPYKVNFYKKEFKKIHKEDYDLYYEGIDKFNQLCKKYL
jgi:hypothetical protein